MLDRETAKVFAENAPASEMGVIGSFRESGGTNPPSGNPPTDIIANNDAFSKGLAQIVEFGNLLPTLEEFNSLFYAFTKWLKYLYQQGVAEWSTNEQYRAGSIVSVNGILYFNNGNANATASPPANGWERISVTPAIMQALQDDINRRVIANSLISPRTATKITYDSKGLVTGGTYLSAGDIPTLSIDQIDGLQEALDNLDVTDSGGGSTGGGTVPISRGGTSATTRDQAVKNLFDYVVINPFKIMAVEKTEDGGKTGIVGVPLLYRAMFGFVSPNTGEEAAQRTWGGNAVYRQAFTGTLSALENQTLQLVVSAPGIKELIGYGGWWEYDKDNKNTIQIGNYLKTESYNVSSALLNFGTSDGVALYTTSNKARTNSAYKFYIDYTKTT